MTVFDYCIPVDQIAQPTRHRTEKHVVGALVEQFEIRDIALPSLAISVREIGRDGIASGEDADDVFTDGRNLFAKGHDLTAGPNPSNVPVNLLGQTVSVIPWMRELYGETLTHIKRKRMRAGSVDLYPDGNAVDAFSMWKPKTLDRRLFKEDAFPVADEIKRRIEDKLLRIACCDGEMYVPVREPMLAIDLVEPSRRRPRLEVRLETWKERAANDTLPSGIAFFRIDALDEANDTARSMAERAGWDAVTLEASIEVNVPLHSDPHPIALAETMRAMNRRIDARLVEMVDGFGGDQLAIAKHLLHLPSGVVDSYQRLTELASRIGTAAAPNVDFDHDAAEELYMACRDLDAGMENRFFISTAAELLFNQWENRPIGLDQGLGPTAPAL